LPSVSIDDQEEEDDAEATGFSLEGTASARTNILLGLRMIPKSHDLWREYIKLELGWVEGLRRRWKVLGVNIESKPAPGSEVDPNALTGGEGSFGPDGEDARKSILSGQLIIHAINSALAAIPSSEAEGMEFRESLVRLLRIYPSALRTKCLEVVYSDLEGIAESAGDEATRARFMVLTKELYDRPYSPGTKDEGGVVLEGAELVDAIGRIGKEIRAVAKSGKGGSAWLDMAGQWLVQQMALCGGNTDLVSDHIPASCLQRLIYTAPISILNHDGPHETNLQAFSFFLDASHRTTGIHPPRSIHLSHHYPITRGSAHIQTLITAYAPSLGGIRQYASRT
jgi:U3 small nucleolar RNA-associated protein 6